MARLKPIYVVLIGFFIMVAIGAVGWLAMLKPTREAIGSERKKLDDEITNAKKFVSTEKALKDAEQELMDNEAMLKRLVLTKTPPLGAGRPQEYLVALWHLYMEDWVPQVAEYVNACKASGVEVLQPGAVAPLAPPLSPPTTINGFLPLLGQSGISVQVRGTYPQIKSFLRRVTQFPRAVVRFSSIALRSVGQGKVELSLQLTPYVIVEEPSGGAAAAGGAPAGGAMPAMPGTSGTMAPPSAPAVTSGRAAAGGTAKAAGGGKEEEEGGLKGGLRRRGGGEE